MTSHCGRAVRAITLLGLGLCMAGLAGCDRPESPKPDPRQRAEGLYIFGTSQYLQGNFDGAIKSFEQMREILPDDPRLPAALGEVFLSQGKLKEALAHYQKAAERDPRRSTNWSRVGFIQNLLGHLDEARVALRKAIGLNPRDFTALEALGDLELKQGNLEEAVRDFTFAAEASPDPDSAGELYVRAARELQRHQREAKALELLQGAAGRGSPSPLLLTEYGELLVRAHRFEDALPVLTDAAQRSPRDPTLWQMVGELEVALDRPGDAIAAWHQSLRIKDRAEVHAALARVHRARKDEAAAQEELEKALRTASGDEAESRELVELLSDFGRKKDALVILTALAEEPGSLGDTALQLRTARLAQEVGEKDTVRAACARAIAAPDAGVRRCPP